MASPDTAAGERTIASLCLLFYLTWNVVSYALVGVKDTPFTVRFYPTQGYSGFKVPNPFRDGSIRIKTFRYSAVTILGSALDDFRWHIVMYAEGTRGGTTEAVISDAGAIGLTSPVTTFNEAHTAFSPDGPNLLCEHCCRNKGIEVTIKTSWSQASY